MAVNPLDALVRHVTTARYADIPAPAVRAAKTFLLDAFACGIGGTTGPETAHTLAAAAAWGDGADAHVYGRSETYPAPTVALINAYQTHSLEYDCVHEGAILHPLTPVLPATLAVAERETRRGRTVSGRDFITALAVGVDVSCTIGLSARSAMRFFRPASIGGFGATAAISRLRGFDAAQCTRAMGIMYGQTSGGMQTHVDGASMLGLQIGFAARNAVFATDLAAAGVDGPKNIITGPWGYLPLYENVHDVDASWHQWGKIWRLTELAHKPFPTGRPTHHAIDALQQLMAAHGFVADDVASVTCRIPPAPFQVIGRPDRPDPTPNYAKLCLAFVCATALRRGNVAPEHFEPAALIDPVTHALAAKVTVVEDRAADPTAFGPQTITVTLTSGAQHELTVDYALGDARNPLSRERQLAKFWWCWDTGARGIPRAKGERLIGLIESLDEVPDITALIACLMP